MADSDQIRVGPANLVVRSEGYVLLRPVQMTDREPGWMAEDVRRPGCVGYGETEKQARDSLHRAQLAYDLVAAEQEKLEEEGELFTVRPDAHAVSTDPWTRSIAPTGAMLTG